MHECLLGLIFYDGLGHRGVVIKFKVNYRVKTLEFHEILFLLLVCRRASGLFQ
jgi:hypothetical protein